ncbi:MAG: carboxypeptidase-like regulatory domain-containing protein [Ruminococcus flavefaciens]|nr:carboxypeptidase-like regulatory domain-containing protein [Ruminococcus flavefaciens]
MKTRKKLLIALLSATCLTAGAFGLAACSDAEPQPDPSLYAIYNQYVADLPAGQEAKTYEKWLSDTLASVATPGENGTNGKDAYELYLDSLGDDATQLTKEEWLVSLVGQSGLTPSVGENGNWYLGETDTGVNVTGNGIASVEWNADKTALVITYTDETTAEIPLPEEVTHVHAYDTDDLTVLIDATDEHDGVGYKTCTKDGCEHIELVVISRFVYRINVLLPNGKPATGLTVNLKGGEVDLDEVVDSKGYANFLKVDKGVYDVTVKGDYVAMNAVKTSLTGDEYTVKLAQSLTNTADGISMPNLEEVGDKVTYTTTTSGEQLENEYAWEPVRLVFSSEQSANYKVTIAADTGHVFFEEYSAWETGYMTAATANNWARELVLMVGDDYNVPNGRLGENDDPYRIFFTVEKIKPAELGSAELPIRVAADEVVTQTFKADEPVYFAFFGYESNYTYETQDGLVFTNLGSNLYEFEYYTEPLDGTELQEFGGHESFFKLVSAAAGEASFTLKSNYQDGEKAKPKALTLGTESSSVGYLGGAEWFTFTVEEAGEYTVKLTGITEASLNVYSAIAYDNAEDTEVWAITSIADLHELAAGTYYLKCQNECGITLAKYNPETDAGISADHAVEINEAKAYELTSVANKYFVYTAPAAGTIWFTSENANFYAFKDEFFNDVGISNGGHFYGYGAFGVDFTSSDTFTTVTEGEKLYIFASANDSNPANVELVYLADPSTVKVDYTLTLVDEDGNPLEGISVNLVDENLDEVAQEAVKSDANGKVTFSQLTPGVYHVSLPEGEEYMNDYLFEDDVNTKEYYRNNETRVVLSKLYTYTVTLVETVGESEQGIAGVSILMQGTYGGGATSGYISKSATTDANGVATFKVPFKDSAYYLNFEVDGKYVADAAKNGEDGYQVRGTYDESDNKVGGAIKFYYKQMATVTLDLSSKVTVESAPADTRYSLTYDRSKKLVITLTSGSIQSLANAGATFVSDNALTGNNMIGWAGMSYEGGVLTIDPANANAMFGPMVDNNYIIIFSTGASFTAEYISNTVSYDYTNINLTNNEYSLTASEAGVVAYEFTIGQNGHYTFVLSGGADKLLYLSDNYGGGTDVYVTDGNLGPNGDGTTVINSENFMGAYYSFTLCCYQGDVINVAFQVTNSETFNITFLECDC